MSTNINPPNLLNPLDPDAPKNPVEPSISSTLDFIKKRFPLYLCLFLGIVAIGKVISESTYSSLWTQDLRNNISLVVLFCLFLIGLFYANLPFLVLVIYIPFSAVLPGRFGGQIPALNLFNLLWAITIISLLIKNIRINRPFFFATKISKWVGILIALSFVNYLMSCSRYGSVYAAEMLNPLKRWLDPYVLFFVTCSAVQTDEERKDPIIAILLGITMSFFLAVKDFSTPTHFSWERRAGGSADQANVMGAFCVDYMFLLLGILMTSYRKKIFWLFLVPFFYGFRSILFSYSRGAYIGFVVCFLLITFIKDKRLFVLTAIFFVVVYYNQSWFLPGSVVERIEMTQSVEQVYSHDKVLEASAMERVLAWRATLELIGRNPLFGCGFGMIPQFLFYMAGLPIGDVHNTYLLLAAEQGLIWLGLLLMVLFKGIRISWYIYRNSPDTIIQGVGLGFMTGIFGMMIVSIFGSHMFFLHEVAYFWILLALVSMEEKQLRAQKLQGAGQTGDR